LYIHARLAANPKKRLSFLAGSILAGFLALGSKETAATLPVFIFLYEWFFFQDLNRSWLKKRLPYLGLALAGFAVIALIYLGSEPVGAILATYRGRDFTLPQRLLTELRVVVFYMGQLLFPHPASLSLEHDIALSSSLLSPLATFFSAALLLALAGIAIRTAKRQRLVSFALIWYLGNLLIESSVIGLEIVFEHRNYLPSMFPVFLMVLFGDRLIKSSKGKAVVAALIVMVFSFWTHERSTVWADEEILMRDSLAKAPTKFRVYYNLGTLLSKKGRSEEAIAVYNRGLEIYPKDGSAKGIDAVYRNLGDLYTNLGNAFSRRGQYDEANKAYYRALKIDPRDPNALLGLGNNALVQKDYSRALSHYRKALSVTNDPVLKTQIRRGLEIAVRKR